MSIRIKMLGAIVLAVMVTLAGVTLIVSIQLQSALTANFKQASQSQLGRVASFVHQFFESTIGDINYIASQPSSIEAVGNMNAFFKDSAVAVDLAKVTQSEPERLAYENLLRLQKSKPWYSIIYIGSDDGGFVQAPFEELRPGFNPPQRPWFIETIKARKPVITEAYLSDNGDVVCTVAGPIVGGKGKGVLGIDITLTTLTDELTRTPIGETGFIVLIDHTGQVLAAPHKTWLGKSVSDLPGEAAGVMTTLYKTDRGATEVDLEGKTWLTGVHTTPENWTLVMMQAKDEIFAEAMGLTIDIFLGGLVILAVMSALAFALSRSIVGPVSVLANAAAKVAEGDLHAIPDQGKGFTAEIGLLHGSLKSMVANLAKFISQAEEKAKEAEKALEHAKLSNQQAEEAKLTADRARREGILETADHLSEIVNALTTAVNNLSGVVATTEDSVSLQRDRIASNATAMTQMNAAIGEVAGSISQTSAMADSTMQQANSGKKIVDDMVASIEQVEVESQTMEKSLGVLGNQATDIGKIIGVINDIADQTNLLALNAAIEAARAGDAGRGFAVVADEVRKLAENTMQATRQVGEAITSIQKGTESNVKAMQGTASLITRSAELAHNAGDALIHIETMVNQTADQMRTVAAATEEQSATIEEINKGTEEVNQMADAVGESAHLSTEEVNRLVQLARQLDNVVQNLRKS